MVFLIFIVFPILELYTLFVAAESWGFFSLVFEAFVSFWVGMMILRFRGIIFLTMVREKLARGESPKQEVVESLLLFMGGVFLMLPGLITDAIGVLCLFPLSRKLFALAVQKWLSNKVAQGQFRVVNMNPNESSSPFSSQGPFSRRNPFQGIDTSREEEKMRDVTPNKDSDKD